MKSLIYTIGHSTRTFEEFIELLKPHEIQLVVDVRRFPGSRRHPHFNKEALEQSLKREGIDYLHDDRLGGRRSTSKTSVNVGWRNTAFRGYADYMQTRDFEAALQNLVQNAEEKTTALMCAEALPWRCHRSLIADALIVRDFRVLDIIDDKKPKERELTAFVEVNGLQLTYPNDPPQKILL